MTGFEKQVNFQIQYFPASKRDKFRKWSTERGVSMRELLLELLSNKTKINNMLKEK